MNHKKITTSILEIFSRLSEKELNPCLTHSQSEEGFSHFLGFNPIETFQFKGKEEFQKELEKFTTKHSKKGHKIMGYFSYDLGHLLHQIKQTSKDDLKLPDIYLQAFDNWLEDGKIHFTDPTFPENIKSILKRKPAPTKKYKSTNFQPTISKTQYSQAYSQIKKHIKEGDIYQINLTHRLEAKTDIPAKELLLKTAKQNPVDFLAYIEGPDFEIISASPERFIKIEKGRIETCPVKGTRPRGKTEKEDEQMVKELIESEKEAAELNMITDLLRNDIGKVSKPGSVKVEDHRLLSKCPTVWHTYSRITGKLQKNIKPIEALISMLSGGSITGCPKKRAMKIIDNLEPTARSVYTGVIGIINPNQDLDFNIAIRTIIKKDKKLYLQVGGGIVLDSENKAEYEETLQKAASFMKIL